MSIANGQRRLAGTRAARSSSHDPCRLTASRYGLFSSANRRIPGTTPTVLMAIFDGPMPMPRTSEIMSSAGNTASML